MTVKRPIPKSQALIFFSVWNVIHRSESDAREQCALAGYDSRTRFRADCDRIYPTFRREMQLPRRRHGLAAQALSCL